MEEDIKLVENLIEEYKMFGDLDGIQDIRPYMKAIENMLNRNKELEEENKIIKGNYITLCADIQMVTTELGFPEDTIISDEIIPMIKENYIPVSLVEETIEEVNKEDENLMYKNNMIKVLQELLKRKENNGR